MSKSIYPSIPAPGTDPASMRASLDAMRQSLNMMIMNAQNPNPNFAPSNAAQVFVTHAQLERLKVIGPSGPQGAKGDQGVPGPAGTGFPEAPSDGTTYGRINGSWDNVLAAGGAVFTTMPVNAANDAAAATAGVVVGGVYRNGSVLMVRVT